MTDKRFQIGDEVQCNMGGGKWADGVVVKLDYRMEDWDEEKATAPYQVKLDPSQGGHLIYAPKDDEKFIRKRQRKVPVTIITGFLGAGKTTLLNHILRSEEHGLKIGIIENEFGAVSIDTDLLKAGQKRTGEEVLIEMKNGCVCCTVRSDLATAFKDILEGRELDHVIIETTGLANPAPVIQTFHLDDFAQMRMTLDAVVTVVDAKHIEQQLDQEKESDDPEAVNEALEQVAFADKILLNKIDLVTKADLDRVERKIRTINKGVANLIMHTQLSKEMPDLKAFFQINAFDINKILSEDAHFLDTEAEKEEQHKGEHGHGHGEHGHGHSHGDGKTECEEEECEKAVPSHNKHVNSFVIRADGDVRMDKLNEFFTTVVQKWSGELYRYKGILAIAGAPMKFVFQGVHMIVNTSPSEPWKPDEKRHSTLVFIGRRIKDQEDKIRELFNTCLVKTDE